MKGDGEACKLCKDECQGYDELEFVSKDWHMCKVKGIIWQVEKKEESFDYGRVVTT